jgi:hypothetical protein
MAAKGHEKLPALDVAHAEACATRPIGSFSAGLRTLARSGSSNLSGVLRPVLDP